jgi:predicted TIM-barrel fold metal-dependent hydrolase
MGIHREIQTAVDAIRVIDTHEHLEEESVRLGRESIDFITLFDSYASHDLISAGMPGPDWERCTRADASVDEKWKLLEPHYRAARNTAYLRAVDIAIRDLYGVEALDADTVGPLTQRMRERNEPGVLSWILRERSGIEVAQINAIEPEGDAQIVPFFREQCDPELFLQDIGVAPLLFWPPPIAALERETGASIGSFAHYEQAIEKLFELRAPIADAIKQQSAYWRVQSFDDVPAAEAERVFDRARRDPGRVTPAEQKTLQDWGFHRCIRLAIEHDLPIKIHTGYKAGFNFMDVSHIQPARLTNLFVQYPEARFDLFHIGYPYQEEVLALAKHFANVYVDMCWAWIIDPQASGRFLKQFVTAVPSNKLFAFGGDYVVAEPVYGHLRIARDGIARALSGLVEEDYLTVPEAVAIARRILRENALEVFRVDEKRPRAREAAGLLRPQSPRS